MLVRVMRGYVSKVQVQQKILLSMCEMRLRVCLVYCIDVHCSKLATLGSAAPSHSVRCSYGSTALATATFYNTSSKQIKRVKNVFAYLRSIGAPE